MGDFAVKVGDPAVDLDQKLTFCVSIQELKDKITEEKGYQEATQRLYLHNQELDDDLEMKDILSNCLDPFQEMRLGKKINHDVRKLDPDLKNLPANVSFCSLDIVVASESSYVSPNG